MDVGVLRQPDPANYALVRVGYEVPLADMLRLQAFVGGAARWMGNDGGSAFTMDALLSYQGLDRFEFAGGAGVWSGRGGQVDLLADVGYRLSGAADVPNVSLVFEARLPADDLGDVNRHGRFGLAARVRF